MSDASLSLEIKELNACVERMCATNDLVELKTAQEFALIRVLQIYENNFACIGRLHLERSAE